MAQPNPYSAETYNLVQISVGAYITGLGPLGSQAVSHKPDGIAPLLTTAPGPPQPMAESVAATTPGDIEPASAAAHTAPEGGTSDRPSTAGGKRKCTSWTPAPPDGEEPNWGLLYDQRFHRELSRGRGGGMLA